MDTKRRILVLHDRDRIGRAIVHQLEEAQVPLRELDEPLPADELVSAAFGCRGIIAVGDRFAADQAVLAAANMPGVRSLVLVVHKTSDFTLLRKRGVPYTVLRVPLLLEDVITVVTVHWQLFVGALLVFLILFFPRGIWGSLMHWVEQ